MRILAVRGENLASLPRFDVRFDEGPQSPGHVVAVVGPTGAGKSTLLDAICLALYDAAPRVAGAPRVTVGEYEAHGGDPCALLRRGTGQGFAEVDFEGRDGLVYRSRWEVWRARKRADGRLQAQRMVVHSLADGRELSGATKTETLEIIRSLVGLSFDEFSRAVLLAQGAFSAFLDAGGDARAELLERMTRTEVYAEISRRAHQKAKESESELARRETEAGAVDVLTPEAADQLKADLKTVEQERAQCQLARDAARVHADWYSQQDLLHREVAEAEERLKQCTDALEETADMRARLEQAQEAEGLRGVYERYMAADERNAALSVQYAAAARAYSVTRASADEAKAATAAAVAKQDALHIELADRSKQLDQARALDVQLAGAEREYKKAKAAQDLTQEALAAVQANREKLLDAFEDAADKIARLSQWLKRNEDLNRVAPKWPRWEKELEELVSLSAVRDDASAKYQHAKEQLTAAAEKTQLSLQKQTAARQALSQAEEQIKALAAPADDSADLSSTQLRETSERLGELRARAEQLSAIDSRFRRSHRRQLEAARQVLEESASVEAAKEALSKLRERQTNDRKDLAEVQEALQRHQTRQGLMERGAELLVPHAPCPLCGSEDHRPDNRPAVASPEPLKAAVQKQQNKLRSTEQELGQATGDLARHERALDDASARQKSQERDTQEHLQAWTDAIGALSMSWVDAPLLSRFGADRAARVLPKEPRRGRATTEVDEAVSILRSAQQQVSEVAEAREQRSQQREALRNKEGELRRELDLANAAYQSATDAEAALQSTLQILSAERDTNYQRIKTTRERLAPPFSKWPDADAALTKDPAGFLDIARQRTEAFLAKQNEKQKLDEEQARREHALKLETEAETKTRHAANQQAAETTQRALELETLRADRKAVLGGRAADEVKAEDEARRAETERLVEASKRSLSELERSLAAAVARRERAEEESQEAAADRTKRLDELESQLADSSFEGPEDLKAIFDLEPALLARQKAEEAARVEAKLKATSRLEDRKRRLIRHNASAAPGVDAEAAAEALKKAEELLVQKVQNEARIQEVLRQDAEALARRKALDLQVSKQRPDTEAWAELAALIGSADGKKLRAFAQGLTLEVLVEQANLHLKNLRPRYTLERAPGTMDLLVVDHDLGEERRPLSTLSGGERFLLSLSLALGLSSLSSRHVHLGSLFIDEGFGALDRDSLDVALSVLDELQAEGRTVVVISHVAELAERIVDRIEVRPRGPGTSKVMGGVGGPDEVLSKPAPFQLFSP